MSRKKFSNGGGQEKCDGTKFAAKFGCDAAAAAVAKHGRCRRQKSFNKKEVKMNKIYRTVYNETTNTWTAVAEIAKAKGKSKSSKTAIASVAVAGALLSSAAVQAEGLKWGNGATAEGDESIAMGVNSTAKSKYTITLGARAKNETNGEAAVIIGNDAKAIADVNASTAANTMGQQVAIGEASVANSQSVALGAQTYATGQASIAIGGDDLGNNDSKTSAGKYTGADAWRNYAGQPITVEGVTTKDASDPAIGFTSTTASGRGSIALGHMGQSTGKASVAIGADSHAEADGAIAAGMVSQATGAAAVAVGVGAQAKKDHATAIGLKAVASETNSFAAGTNAQASKTGATAVGVDSNALAEHSIAIGSNAKVSQTAPTTTQNTKGVSDASIAIGQTSYAEGLAAVAVGAKTKAIEHAVAIGTETKAEGLSAVAIGSNSQATTTNSVAVGTTSKASGANATALGQATQALGQSSVAVGDGAVSTAAGWGTAVGNSSEARYGASAYGHLAKATGEKSVAIGDSANGAGNNAVAVGNTAAGQGENAVAIGNTAAASASNGIAVGNNAKAKAVAAVAIGASAGLTSDETTKNTNTRAVMIGVSAGHSARDINDSVLIGWEAGKDLGKANQSSSNNIGLGARALSGANGSTNVALATQAGLGATGNNNFFGQVNAGSYVTGDNNVAIGKNALKGTDAAKLTVSDAVALGTDATANKDKAVALGAGASTATEAKQISTATVGSTTYGGFVGKVNATGYQVSVGAKDAERQLKHVAPGEISSTSTDAINGSQLYSVASGLQTQIANISSSGGNVHFYHVNGASTDNNYNNDGATGAKAMAAGINAKAKGASSIAIGNATVEKESTANGAGTAKTESEGAIAIGDTSYAAGTHAIAMGQARAEQKDSIAVGSNARSTAEYTVAIGQNAVSSKQNAISIGSSSNTAADNSIAIGSNSSTSSNGSVALGHGSQATRDAINATAVKATSTAAVAQNQVYALDAASNTDKNNIAATVKGASGAVSVGTQQDTRQIINVAAGTEDSDAVNVAQLKSVANLVKNTTPTKVAPATGSKITVNNKGTATAPDYELDLSADAKTSLNKADTAMQNFKVATVPSKGGTQTAGENVGNGETLTFEAGDNVSISQTGKKITINATGSGASKVEAATNSPITVGGTGTATDPYKVGVSTVALTHTARGVVNTPAATDAGKLVTAGEIAKAINNSGFIATSGKSGTGQVSGTSEELVNPGDIVKFTAGNGIKIEQNKGEFTISNIAGGASGTPSVVEAATNNPITVGGTGTAADPYKVGVSTVALTNSATGTVNAPNATDSGKLVTAGEVAKAINGSGFTLKTSAVSGEGEKDAASTTDEIVNPGDAVEMIAGKNLKVKQSADGKVTYSTKDAVQFNTVTVGGVSIDQNNGINAGSKKITNVAAGSVSATSR
ncbi:Hep_Hag superfamily protein, partial [Neisseria bacilliformis ATCC BAA-1200]